MVVCKHKINEKYLSHSKKILLGIHITLESKTNLEVKV